MRRPLVLTLLLVLGLVACQQTALQSGGPATSPANGTPPAADPVPTATNRPAATPGATPQFPAPLELQGTWRALADDDDKLILRVGASDYTIIREIRGFATRGSGRIEVDGDEIVFSHSNLCAGIGHYRWAIDGDVLRFTPVAPDPCPRPFEGIEYTRDG